jgi:hypothetical protein
MAWLGEEIAPATAGALAPRCVKDLIEERLFDRRRDLFSDLSLVFMCHRLRERFHIGRVCVVADRGMISAATIAALERKLEYILGTSATAPSSTASCSRMKRR